MRFLLILAFMFAYTPMAVVTAQHVGGASAKLQGVVTDAAGTTIAGARILIEGRRHYAAETNEDGFYRISLPPGTYRVRAEAAQFHFSPTLRAPIDLRQNSSATLNFTMFGPRSVLVPYDAKPGEPAMQTDESAIIGFKYEAVYLPPSAGKLREALIRFGEKEERGGEDIYTAFVPSVITGGGRPYPAVMLSYDQVSIQAHEIRVNRNTYRIKAIGDVVIDEGGQRKTGIKEAIVEIRRGRASIRVDATESPGMSFFDNIKSRN